MEQQRERHETIEKQLAGQHSSGVEELQKKQRTLSKKVASTLKKITPMDEEVGKLFFVVTLPRTEIEPC